jgi:hypothetical protein
VKAAQRNLSKGGIMNISSLSDQAQLILQQRLSTAATVRMTKHVCRLHRSQKRLARAMASGLREGVTMDGMISELARISQISDFSQAK